MDWMNIAKTLFKAQRPEHFTNHEHCEECAEHDQTLLSADIETIGLDELGNPGWEPICFTSAEGKKYFLPAFIRLSIETINDEFYFGQFLFHLEGNGPDNQFYLSCSEEQREFIASFISYMIENYSEQIKAEFCTDEALRCRDIWSNS